PITSGDTAFRSARLIIADFLKMPQKAISKRMLIALPMFVLGYRITKTEFDVIWRYFGWANQTTAMMMLWTAAAYLLRHGKFHWVATVPAMFMTAVCFTYLANAKIGFNLPMDISTVIGLGATVAVTVLFFLKIRRCDKAIVAEQNS
ncbi:MAG: carbon starvation CstA family protein, partial [Plesiomonas shigelloides]